MAIVRINIGRLYEHQPDEIALPTTKIDNGAHYYDELHIYLMALLGFAHLAEAYGSGKSEPYQADHLVLLGCRQEQARWVWAPAVAATALASNANVDELTIERVADPIPHGAGEHMRLGAVENLLFHAGQGMFTNFYEKLKPSVEAAFGDVVNWPTVWNFGRIVRNAMSHGGAVYFTNPNAASVNWKSLSYIPSDNGRPILHHDLWPGDLIDLMREMDNAAP